jgi:hypothetical protein
MINIDYSDGIKITTKDLSKVFTQDQLPLLFKIKKVISKEIIWSTELNDNMWASYPENEINDVVVYDAKGNFIYQYRWDPIEHGSVFYKSLWLYCKSLINKGIKPKGLVIGTHDGEFGEWVPLFRNFMSEMVLVEGSEKQFSKLRDNYQGKQDNIVLLNKLVTPDGADVDFFEGGRGYTNSVVKRVIEYWEKEEICSTKKESISFNDLIFENFTTYNKKMDWLHLDVEGLDAKLIMSVNSTLLPPFIIFEDFNLLPEEKIEIYNYLKNIGYTLNSENGICSAIKPF